MKIIKRINHNAAIALDQKGNELVVLGKGIGFPQVPYELNDLSKISKTFYDLDPIYMDMVPSLPQEMLLAAADIIEQAKIELDCELNPNAVITLADHLNFALERQKKGIVFDMPFSYDIEHLYPREYELGLLALDVVEDYTGQKLPQEEIANIAMHIIYSELEKGDMHEAIVQVEILTEVDRIIEEDLGIQLDKDSFSYSRFSTHLRYLVQRLQNNKPMENNMEKIIGGLIYEFPEIYKCTLHINNYFKEKWGWECTKDELLYLMLHINRLMDKQD